MVSLDKIAMSVVVFFVFIIGGVLFLHDAEDKYADYEVDMGVDDYIETTYERGAGTDISENDPNQSTTLYEFGQNTESKLMGSELDEDATEDSMFKGSYSAVRLITTPITLIHNVMKDFADQIGIPPIFVQFGFLALIISVMFAVIYLIFRVKA